MRVKRKTHENLYYIPEKGEYFHDSYVEYYIGFCVCRTFLTVIFYFLDALQNIYVRQSDIWYTYEWFYVCHIRKSMMCIFTISHVSPFIRHVEKFDLLELIHNHFFLDSQLFFLLSPVSLGMYCYIIIVSELSRRCSC